MSLYDMSTRPILTIQYGLSDTHIIRCGTPEHIYVRHYKGVTGFTDCYVKSLV